MSDHPTPEEVLAATENQTAVRLDLHEFADPDDLAADLDQRRAVHRIAGELAELRRTFGRSQAAVAAAAGMHQPAISRIERAPEVIQISTLLDYLGGLGDGTHATLHVERDGITHDLQLL